MNHNKKQGTNDTCNIECAAVSYLEKCLRTDKSVYLMLVNKRERNFDLYFKWLCVIWVSYIFLSYIPFTSDNSSQIYSPPFPTHSLSYHSTLCSKKINQNSSRLICPAQTFLDVWSCTGVLSSYLWGYTLGRGRSLPFSVTISSHWLHG